MPFILSGRQYRLAFQFGPQSASDVIRQLQAQLDAERAHAGTMKAEIAALLKERLALRVEVARRDTIDAVARTPSPSAMVH